MTTDTDVTTFERLARELSQAFTGDTRADGTPFRKLKEGSPEWMTTVIHEAHGDMMPDDWRYAFCVSAPAPCYKSQRGATVPLRGCTGILRACQEQPIRIATGQ